jgi:hypothetical protein
MFFKQYYKEAFSHLNREQRLSYQLIHAALDNLNKKNDDLAKFFEESHKDLRDASDEEKVSNIRAEWEERVILLYKTTNEVLWHIVYHLRYPDAPTLDHMGPIHESYLKFEQELDIEVKTIIEKAKTLKRDDFEKYYDEGTFARHQAAR